MPAEAGGDVRARFDAALKREDLGAVEKVQGEPDDLAVPRQRGREGDVDICGPPSRQATCFARDLNDVDMVLEIWSWSCPEFVDGYRPEIRSSDELLVGSACCCGRRDNDADHLPLEAVFAAPASAREFEGEIRLPSGFCQHAKSHSVTVPLRR